MNLVANGLKISKLHKNSNLISFAMTGRGRALLWLVSTALLWSSKQVFWIAPLLALFLIRPLWRRELLCAGSIAFLYHSLISRSGWQNIPTHFLVIVGTLLFIYFIYLSARKFRSLPMVVQRRPLVCLHFVLWPMMVVVWFLPSSMSEPWRNFFVPFRWILPLLAWRLSYLLLAGKRGTLKNSSFLDHLWYCVPCFGGSNVPYGKGSDYLNSNRADEKEDIARVQLSGIKLLVLSKVWLLLQIPFAAVVYGRSEGLLAQMLQGHSLGLAPLGELIQNGEASLIVSWGSLIGELIYLTLTMAAVGHLIIGCLRLFGYAVFRNTYKPLLAETVVEFWNRFYYYFKELLVEFFFFPVFASYFKNKPRLRMFAAVMSAAFVGNVYYHIMRDFGVLGSAGPAIAFEHLLPRVFYSFLLGIGIFVSMQRQQSRRGTESKDGGRGRILRLRNIAMVWLFYSLIHIWNVNPVGLTFVERSQFFFSLIGLA